MVLKITLNLFAALDAGSELKATFTKVLSVMLIGVRALKYESKNRGCN